MKILKWFAIVAVVLVVGFIAVGFALPSKYKVERTATINAPAEKVYVLIADPRAWTKWTVWNRREPNMKMTFSGAPSGQGAKWAWEGKDGNGNMEFTRAEPNQAIEYALAFPDMGMSSKGALHLTAAGSSTKISWTNEGDVGSNPLMRWFVPFMDAMMGPDFAGGLANLKVMAEKS